MDWKSDGVKRSSQSSVARFSLVLVAGLAICMGVPSVSRADRIDEALISHAPEITKYLVQKGCKNVGVLPFRLQKGDKLPQFRGGLIVNNMVDRVQHSLVFAANPEAPPIGIVDFAAKKGHVTSYRTVADRKNLFKVEYPLLWGKPPRQVPVDTFLTGKVAVSSDYRTAIVTIEAIDRTGSLTKKPVSEFKVKSDRYILADLGRGYSVKQVKLSRGIAAAGDIIEDGDPPPSGNPTTTDSLPEPKVENGVTNGTDSSSQMETVVSLDNSDKSFPVEWTVYYDGVAQAPQADPDSPGGRNFVIADPQPGQKVTFGVKNTGGSTLGLVLTVNGVSTLYEDTGLPDQMQPWILAPGTQFAIRGFHQKDGKTYVPIVGFGVEDTQSILDDLGSEKSAGLIELFVIKPGAPAAQQVALSRSIRHPSQQVMPAGPATSLEELQRGLTQGTNFRSTRGLMAGNASDKGSENLKYADFQSGPPSDHVVIRYYKVPK